MAQSKQSSTKAENRLRDKAKIRRSKRDGVYRVFLLDTGGCVGEFAMPCDNQIVLDVKTMMNITEQLVDRWLSNKGGSSNVENPESSFYEIEFRQVDISEYWLYLPNGIMVGRICTPQDFNYSKDIAVIKEICKQLAYRFGLK